MSVGVPSVASAIGMNNEIIRDGVNGFLASTEDEWVEKLSILIEDKALRDQFHLQGRSTIETKYSYDAVIPKFGDALRDAAAN
jgi:glycosyltransferase involved in cell wall biosynthesis